VGRGGAGTAVTVKRSAGGGFKRSAKHTLLRALHGGHTGPPRRENGALDSRHAGFI